MVLDSDAGELVIGLVVETVLVLVQSILAIDEIPVPITGSGCVDVLDVVRYMAVLDFGVMAPDDESAVFVQWVFLFSTLMGSFSRPARLLLLW